MKSEKDLRARCISCGKCAQVCRFKCIELTPDHFLGGETPKVYQNKAPCYLCMRCGPVCPTGALAERKMETADMGLAAIDLDKCVNYQEVNKIMCWTCYDRCPLRGKAIILKNGYTATITEQCVGCGVCEYVCPARAITTTPARSLSPAALADKGGSK